MKDYDFMPDDTVVADGILHYNLNDHARELIRKHFPDREDLVEEIANIPLNTGIECDGRELLVLEANDDYVIFQLKEFAGVYITHKETVDEYLTIREIIPGGPVILPKTLLDLLEAAT